MMVAEKTTTKLFVGRRCARVPGMAQSAWLCSRLHGAKVGFYIKPIHRRRTVSRQSEPGGRVGGGPRSGTPPSPSFPRSAAFFFWGKLERVGRGLCRSSVQAMGRTQVWNSSPVPRPLALSLYIYFIMRGSENVGKYNILRRKCHCLNVKVDTDTANLIESEAEKKGKTKSSIIRDAIRKYLRDII